jgi:hypothetical protein
MRCVVVFASEGGAKPKRQNLRQHADFLAGRLNAVTSGETAVIDGAVSGGTWAV